MTTKQINRIDVSDIIADTSLTSEQKLSAEVGRFAESVGITLEQLEAYQELINAAEFAEAEEPTKAATKTTKTTLETVVDPIEQAQTKVDEYYAVFAANYAATAAFAGGGSGTVDDPYIITTPEQMQAPNDDLTAAYALGDDIDMTGIEHIPIGTSAAPFRGSFDGRGFMISNLTIDLPESNYVGLFGYCGGVTLRDLSVNTADVSGNNRSGILAGQFTNSGIINRVSVDGIFTGSTSSSYVGVIGVLSQESVMSDISVSGSVSGNTYVGGAVGSIGPGAKIYRCISNIDVSGVKANSGGIVGGTAGVSTVISSSVGIGSVVSGSVGSTARINGSFGNYEGVRTNNYANAAMLVNGATVTSSDPTSTNGADVDAATYHTKEFWKTVMGFKYREDMPEDGDPNEYCWFDTADGIPSLTYTDLTQFFSAGSGKVDDPFIISTPEEWMSIKHIYTDIHCKLSNDIDFAGIAYSAIPRLNGNVDGNGKTLKNVSDTTVKTNKGLFEIIGKGATLQNLKCNDVLIGNASSSGGVFVGLVEGGNVINCVAEHCTVAGNAGSFGGLVGSAQGDYAIDECSVGKSTVVSTGASGGALGAGS